MLLLLARKNTMLTTRELAQHVESTILPSLRKYPKFCFRADFNILRLAPTSKAR